MKKINPETWRNYKFAGEEDGKNCTIYYLSDSDGSGKGKDAGEFAQSGFA